MFVPENLLPSLMFVTLTMISAYLILYDHEGQALLANIRLVSKFIPETKLQLTHPRIKKRFITFTPGVNVIKNFLS